MDTRNTKPDFPCTFDWVSTEGAARALDLEPETLRDWRRRGFGPPFVQISQRIVRYRLSDIHAWMESQKRNPSEVK